MPFHDEERKRKWYADWRRQHRIIENERRNRWKKKKRRQLRWEVKKKTSGLCHLCGKLLDRYWHIDHKIPKSKGGSDDIENLWPACAACNRKASNHSAGDDHDIEFNFGWNFVAFSDDYEKLRTSAAEGED